MQLVLLSGNSERPDTVAEHDTIRVRLLHLPRDGKLTPSFHLFCAYRQFEWEIKDTPVLFGFLWNIW